MQYMWPINYPQRGVLRTSLGQSGWPNFQRWWVQYSNRCVATSSPYCGRRL